MSRRFRLRFIADDETPEARFFDCTMESDSTADPDWFDNSDAFDYLVKRLRLEIERWKP